MSQYINYCTHKNLFALGIDIFANFHNSIFIVLYENQDHTKSLPSYDSAPRNLFKNFYTYKFPFDLNKIIV